MLSVENIVTELLSYIWDNNYDNIL